LCKKYHHSGNIFFVFQNAFVVLGTKKCAKKVKTHGLTRNYFPFFYAAFKMCKFAATKSKYADWLNHHFFSNCSEQKTLYRNLRLSDEFL